MEQDNRKEGSTGVILEPAVRLSQIEALRDALERQGDVYELGGVLDAAKAHVTEALSLPGRKKLVLFENETRAREFLEEFQFFEPDAMFYPAKDLLFYQADVRSNTLARERMQVIEALLEDRVDTVVSTVDACMNQLDIPEAMGRGILRLSVGDTCEIADLAQKLVEAGYENAGSVENPGEFARRGGILDVFSLTAELPFRIEFWDDEIDSIREFEPGTQKSQDNVDEACIYPANDDAKQGCGGSLLAYFPDDALVFLSEPAHILERGQLLYQEYAQSLERRAAQGMDVPPEWQGLLAVEAVFGECALHPCVLYASITAGSFAKQVQQRFDIRQISVNAYHGDTSQLAEELQSYVGKKYRVFLAVSSRTKAKRLAEELQDFGLNAYFSQGLSEQLFPGDICVFAWNLRAGFEYPDARAVFITESDIFGKVQKKRRRKHYEAGEKIHAFSELSPGDYVVHENYGIGRYEGLEQMELDGIVKDYVKISYAKGSELYVLASQLDLITKYGQVGDTPPHLSDLGGSGKWTKTKHRVKAEIAEIAKDLVELYALRKDGKGYCYEQDTVWQKEFEESFPYEETESQLAAIMDVKRDMESDRIMDRLVCGDVGFGKTEIALRAAFKAVQDSRQVVYLCPTTILCRQHFQTFSNRMKDYPITVAQLSRFCTDAENTRTLHGLANGSVDIVIATHKALSEKVRYKALGLLIIDEEQRFGVRHKEKIKQMKQNVDVLSLSATPIPRTLHTSLIGVRDMSLLEDPPLERTPIQTFVFEQNDEMVREAIVREMDRGGQVYYVVRKIEKIEDVAVRLENLVPGARVAYAHGRMPKERMDHIMTDFINKDLDVLVATTIIEIGLDISNVNTIIIQDADKFGLAQLYQLRGRVGRGSRTAYAFLMYKRDKLLKETAEKRLAAIKEFTELGSGFRIAMRDLEIRGAGNLLGEAQSGHIEEIGYELYCKLLSEAMALSRGGSSSWGEEFETSVDLRLDAHIPKRYVPDEEARLDLYKRIAVIASESEKEEFIDELIDRFGDPPKAVTNLIFIAKLKNEAHRCYISKIKQSGRVFGIDLYPKARLDAAKISGFVEAHHPYLSFVPDVQKPRFVFDSAKDSRLDAKKLPEYVEEIVAGMQKILLTDDGT